MNRQVSRDQAQLFGYINPIDASPCVHPPLCACGACNIPVERFPQPAAILTESVPDSWEVQ